MISISYMLMVFHIGTIGWGGGGNDFSGLAKHQFLCLRPVRVPEALCFWVVRPSIPTGISLPRNLKNPWVDFYHTWPRGSPWGVHELIRFWARSAKGQWSMKYAIFTSLPRNLKNPWVDFYQTWHRRAPWGVDELIRFWARSAQGQRSMNLV